MKNLGPKILELIKAEETNAPDLRPLHIAEYHALKRAIRHAMNDSAFWADYSQKERLELVRLLSGASAKIQYPLHAVKGKKVA